MRIHKRADRSGPEPGPGESWPLARVDIVDAKDNENIARSAVDRWILDGVVTLDRGTIVLHSEPKLVYKIIRGPGRYSCFDDAGPFDSEDDALAYNEANHPDEGSPDPSNPVGYYVADYYACEKVTDRG